MIGLMALLLAVTGDPTSTRAASARSTASLEQQVLAELNRIRAAPDLYAEDLRTFRTWYDGRYLHLPEYPAVIITQEGVSAVDEALAATVVQPPLPALEHSPVLAAASADHAAYLADGADDHFWSDGTGPGDRVSRHGGGPYVGEIISFGHADPVEVARQFIVDDGVPDRGHRLAVFRGNYRYAGVACGPHRRYRATCVVTLSETPDGRPPSGTGHAAR